MVAPVTVTGFLSLVSAKLILVSGAAALIRLYFSLETVTIIVLLFSAFVS